MKTRLVNIVICALVLCLLACPLPAWADSHVNLSADGTTATADDAPFALEAFERASAGSNRPVDGAYCGFGYYIGTKPTDLMYVATQRDVVVYLDAQAAAHAGLDPSQDADQSLLKTCLQQLDQANLGGGYGIAADAHWHFTTEKEADVDGVLFRFDARPQSDAASSAGAGYIFVIGSDGSDVTDPANPLYSKPTHACFARIVSADGVVLAAEPSWWEQAATFLTTLNWSPLWITLKTTGTAIIFIFILGLIAAYGTLHVGHRTRDILDTIFTIPMVLPPTVCGFLLLLALGNNTAFGRFFSDVLLFPLTFSWQATVIAAVVVAFPLMYRSARGAFESLDPNMLDAARTLGWSESKVFFRLMLPLSWSSIAAGTVLAFARALGEFGATLFLAGNYLGITRTIPIAIYFEWMNGNTDIALFWTGIILIFSFIVILFINLWSRHTTKYRKEVAER